MHRQIKYKVEDDLLLPPIINRHHTSRYHSKKKIAYSICHFFKKNLRYFWKNIIGKLCACFYTKKEEHLCFFLNVRPEYDYYSNRPFENIIFWGESTDENVFFSEQEQLAINHMKQKMYQGIKKYN